ncbi:MAG TPA: type II toxin-antitoxin system VapC family toxin [Candidatus Polarisedimenticolaceae bacterium]|nr:type II toxin-antitoxin system VapC family toxin [Candidatus Polarisedimenticolaceae bacterium]
MNVIDSSAWLEYFGDGPNASAFSRPIEHLDELLVPSITLLEVFRVVARKRGEVQALHAVMTMQQGKVIDLDAGLAVSAAKICVEAKLPLADAVVLATARAHDATLWTQDADFKGMPGVEYRKPQKGV